ncbi:MAG: hypothetical protein H6582_14575 [Crocinitomicaceae bacterium]|nr:hypothetical protein [Crocinitomicaceae bacterium]
MKNQVIILVLSFLLFACSGGSETAENNDSTEEIVEEGSHLFLSGKIAEKYEIMLSLQLPGGDGNLQGEYYYVSQAIPIELDGQKTGNHLMLDEYVEHENTGQFEGDLSLGDPTTFSGVWRNKKGDKELSVQLSEISEEQYAEKLQDKNLDGDGSALTWDQLLARFPKVKLPKEVEFDGSKEMFDTNTIKTYFTDGEWDDFGWNEYRPIFRFESDNYIALVVEHFFSPGAFGINNNFIELYTFTKSGEKIQGFDLGCHCSATNMGSNDFFTTTDNVTFDVGGRISIERENYHGTLFEEEMEEGEALIDEKEIQYIYYLIHPDGKIDNYGKDD